MDKKRDLPVHHPGPIVFQTRPLQSKIQPLSISNLSRKMGPPAYRPSVLPASQPKSAAHSGPNPPLYKPNLRSTQRISDLSRKMGPPAYRPRVLPAMQP